MKFILAIFSLSLASTTSLAQQGSSGATLPPSSTSFEYSTEPTISCGEKGLMLLNCPTSYRKTLTDSRPRTVSLIACSYGTGPAQLLVLWGFPKGDGTGNSEPYYIFETMLPSEIFTGEYVGSRLDRFNRDGLGPYSSNFWTLQKTPTGLKGEKFPYSFIKKQYITTIAESRANIDGNDILDHLYFSCDR